MAFLSPPSLGLAFSHLKMRSQFRRKYGSSVFAIKTDDLLSLDVPVVWAPDLFFTVGSALQLRSQREPRPDLREGQSFLLFPSPLTPTGPPPGTANSSFPDFSDEPRGSHSLVSAAGLQPRSALQSSTLVKNRIQAQTA